MRLIATRVSLGTATTAEELRRALWAGAHPDDRLQHVSVLDSPDRSGLVVAFWVESGALDSIQRCAALLDRVLGRGGSPT